MGEGDKGRRCNGEMHKAKKFRGQKGNTVKKLSKNSTREGLREGGREQV